MVEEEALEQRSQDQIAQESGLASLDNPHFARRPGELLGTHQRLSLRSLAFILCSAIRRAPSPALLSLSLPTEIAGENLGKWPRTCLQKWRWRWRSRAYAVSCEHYKPAGRS